MISEASFENAKTSSVVLLPWWISQWEKEDCLLKTEEKLRGLSWLCNHTDAKWSAVWRGHLRPEHLDNELRCNPKLRWTAVYPPRSPSLVLYRQCRFSLFTSQLSLFRSSLGLFSIENTFYSPALFTSSFWFTSLPSSPPSHFPPMPFFFWALWSQTLRVTHIITYLTISTHTSSSFHLRRTRRVSAEIFLHFFTL